MRNCGTGVCKICGKEFQKKSGSQKYCNQCMTRKCSFCGNHFVVREYLARQRYCSKDCCDKDKIGTRLGVDNPNPSKEKVEIVCEFCGKIFYVHEYRHISAKYCSKRCVAKSKTQENAPNWMGGITTKNHRIRCSEEMKKWRDSVFARDDYTCQHCGDNSGGNLNAHHIIPFSKDESLRFEVSNGITLCEKCHKKEHKRLLISKTGQTDIFACR